ncbi:scavenger receptor cysteine-rich domain superfamily protein-like [Diadema antillarum]|uniref:scavenger receptor cysteine-rich domain superfamily protein-like n=1 Tax=Diadema antillarum TaxID=105358 RepID=UPI003A88914D
MRPCASMDKFAILILVVGAFGFTTADYEGEVRLVNGPVASEGRVEIYHNGEWGTVCDDIWGIDDAAVVCRQLGYQEAWQARGSAYFGQGRDAQIIWLDNVNCAGNELQLSDCLSAAWSTHNCLHSEDAGVKCGNQTFEGDVRLTGGSNPREGRVEVFYGGQWGTVCSDSFWSNTDARVVCRQLGFEGGTSRIGSTTDVSSPILFGTVSCNGLESKLTDCYKIDPLYCNRYITAEVRCEGGLYGDEGSIRLVGGEYEQEGRVEFYYNNEWGTICGDQWGLPDAQVVCRQLGYAGVIDSNAYHGSGSGAIHLDEVACLGSESSLADCAHSGWGSYSYCGHSQDIGVRCSLTEDEGNVRLVDGSSSLEGRVEISYNDEWGTVCNDQWDFTDAQVVCRQLGFAGVDDHEVYFGSGVGSIHLDDVECLGSENRLVECSHRSWGSNNCDHTEDVGVRCSVTDNEGNLRLVDGLSDEEGRVEIYHDDEWGTVCDDQWGYDEAKVVCSQLGFPGVDDSYVSFGSGTGTIHLDDVSCLGSESRLADCTHRGWGSNNCQHTEDVGVRCSYRNNEGNLRLVDGLSDEEGRVEIYHDDEWGTVCDDQWGYDEAKVVCSQLGFPGVDDSYVSFGSGTGTIHLDDVSCLGSESRLADCTHRGWGSNNCQHTEDVGVRCSYRNNEGNLRLVDGLSDEEGRVEIYHDDEWGTVCGDQWGYDEAKVVCSQLGFPGVDDSYVSFGSGTGTIHLDDVSCLGSESRLADCTHRGWGSNNCQHTEDVGVRCSYRTSRGLETWVIAIIVVISLGAFITFSCIVIAACASAKKKSSGAQNRTTVAAFTVSGGNYPSAAGPTTVHASSVYPTQPATVNFYPPPPSYTTVMGPAASIPPIGSGNNVPLAPHSAINPSQAESDGTTVSKPPEIAK